MKLTSRLLANFVGFGCLFSPTVSSGAVLTFTIDSSQSYLGISLELTPGAPFTTAQFAGSDSTSVYGSQLVDVTGSSVQILSTGAIGFTYQPVPVSPDYGGVFPGSTLGQIGLRAFIPGVIGGPGPGGTGLVAARGLVADGSSGVIPLIGSSFDASQISVNFVSGILDYNLLILGSPFVGSLGGFSGVTNQLTDGTLTLAGNQYTITVPIYAEGGFTFAGVPIREIYSGQIVATAAVPESSSLLLAALAVFGFVTPTLRRRWRR